MLQTLSISGLFAVLSLGNVYAQAGIPTPAARSMSADYKIGTAEGSIFQRSDGSLTWSLNGSSIPFNSQGPLSIAWDIKWTGSARRFLVSGYDAPAGLGKIALIDLQENPVTVQVLSVIPYQGEPLSLAYNDLTSTLFVYDYLGSTIDKADFQLVNNQLPAYAEFEEILDLSVLPQFNKNLFLLLFSSLTDPVPGVILNDSGGPSNTLYDLKNIGGEWALKEIPEEGVPSWEPASMYTPAQGPLTVFVAGQAYTVKRLDVEGDPIIVSSGNFGKESPSIGSWGQLALPQGGLVPGARYYVENIEVAETKEPTAEDGSAFTPLLRYGIPFSGGNVKIWQGTNYNRSELGSVDYKISVYMDWLVDPGIEQDVSLFLYWGLPNPDGTPPIIGIGDSALLSNPLGAISSNVTLGGNNFNWHGVDAPLTDPRLTVDELVYFQWAAAVNASTVVVSDVFATTVFPANSASASSAGSPGIQAGAVSPTLGTETLETERVWRMAFQTLRNADANKRKKRK